MAFNKEQKHEDNRDLYMILFALVVLLLSISYVRLASRATELTPTDNTAMWGIGYVDIQTVDATIGADNSEEPILNNTSIVLKPGFKTDDDYITYQIRVKNNGTLNATLNSIYVYNPDYDTFDYIFKGIHEGDILLAGNTKVFTLTIKVKKYAPEISNDFFINLNYVQK